MQNLVSNITAIIDSNSLLIIGSTIKSRSLDFEKVQVNRQ